MLVPGLDRFPSASREIDKVELCSVLEEIHDRDRERADDSCGPCTLPGDTSGNKEREGERHSLREAAVDPMRPPSRREQVGDIDVARVENHAIDRKRKGAPKRQVIGTRDERRDPDWLPGLARDRRRNR